MVSDLDALAVSSFVFIFISPPTFFLSSLSHVTPKIVVVLFTFPASSHLSYKTSLA